MQQLKKKHEKALLINIYLLFNIFVLKNNLPVVSHKAIILLSVLPIRQVHNKDYILMTPFSVSGEILLGFKGNKPIISLLTAVFNRG